ncbi:MAG TPA: ubiquinol-cytochrome C chaperone family protein [Alphaproteobacteria bacterium]|jgi:cytochrome b pre-mRNA-processing protein 3|nr:ubiquinol-cytochrome C chaperone family protein [Alphaproteobacteria bacterium]
MIFKRFFKRTEPSDEVYLLYRAVVAQARMGAFYEHLGVPDTLDGRYDLLVLHCHLVARRLRLEDAAGVALGQALFDLMMADMDRSLREMGVGDLSVGSRVKAMARAYYGRAKAYDEALAAAGPPENYLSAALRRNVYGSLADDRGPQAAQLAALAGHVLAQIDHLAATERQALLAGEVDFLPPPGAKSAPPEVKTN